MKARFIRVKCKDCGNVQMVFERPSKKIVCRICGSTLANPAGGRGIITGEIVNAEE